MKRSSIGTMSSPGEEHAAEEYVDDLINKDRGQALEDYAHEEAAAAPSTMAGRLEFDVADLRDSRHRDPVKRHLRAPGDESTVPEQAAVLC
jgi:hypothetical protein